MATLVFSMNQSLDGYVDHDRFGPGPTLFRRFVEEARTQTGSLYGRRVYELMRYWDDDDPGWGEDEREFAVAHRRQPKWVVSNSLTEVGENASLLTGDLAEAVRRLKAGHDGEIAVAGPRLAGSLSELGLIDEYRIYLHPVVLGGGDPYFVGPRPRLRLRLAGVEQVDDDVLRLSYVPAAGGVRARGERALTTDQRGSADAERLELRHRGLELGGGRGDLVHRVHVLVHVGLPTTLRRGSRPRRTPAAGCEATCRPSLRGRC